MKCQNCGKNEVTFHYSSNINGCVTESHLCSECAEKSGYSLSSAFSSGSIFDGFFPTPVRSGGLMPMMGLITPFLFGVPQQMGILVQNDTPGCTCGNHAASKPEQAAEVDGEMQKRREINIMREQMLKAAENEDFEKAAELRDKIKQIES